MEGTSIMVSAPEGMRDVRALAISAERTHLGTFCHLHGRAKCSRGDVVCDHACRAAEHHQRQLASGANTMRLASDPLGSLLSTCPD
jgi:hypothetical protein